MGGWLFWGSEGGATSARKFCIFFCKNNFILELFWLKNNDFKTWCSDSTFCRFHKLHHCFSITAHQSNLPILFITVTLLSSWRTNDIQWRLVYKAGASRHLRPYSDSQRNKIRMQCWLRINERWKLIRLFDVLLKYIEPLNWWPRRWTEYKDRVQRAEISGEGY